MLLGLGFLLGGAAISRMMESAGGVVITASMGAVIGVVCLAFAVLYVIDGVGLLKLKNWARVLTIVLVAIGLAGSARNLVMMMGHFAAGPMIQQLIPLVIDIWILVYLFRPNVRQAFGAA